MTDFPALSHIRPSASIKDQQKAAQDLIGRVLGEKASHFKVVIMENEDPQFRDTFNVRQCTNEKVFK